MSTGLTFVRVLGTNWELGTVYSFSSYDEAYKWAEWQVRLINVPFAGGIPSGFYSIWTSSPNQNGYFSWNGTAAVFTAYS